MIRVVASSSPIEVAWASFDKAMIELHRLYGRAASLPVELDERSLRRAKAQEVARLWEEWRELFLTPDGGPTAA